MYFPRIRAEIFAAVERTGTWPDALLQSYVALIPKGEGAAPDKLRPITVMSAVDMPMGEGGDGCSTVDG